MNLRKIQYSFFILIIFVFRSFGQDIPIRQMSVANSIAIANGTQSSVNIFLSSDKNSWQTVHIDPFNKKIYRTPVLYVNIKTNGVEEKYELKKSIDSIYVVYWDASFSRYKIARRKMK